MTTSLAPSQYSQRESGIAVAIYGAILLGVIATAVFSLTDLAEVYDSSSASAATLAQMEGRVAGPPATAMPAGWPPGAPKGSAFLEGDTMTVAGAALLQRVAGAVGRVGGVVLSSQVELQASASASEAGRIGLVVSGEMDQAALQDFLYDVEGGMPFLFVEQLMVQPASGAEGSENTRARIAITMSSQWRSVR